MNAARECCFVRLLCPPVSTVISDFYFVHHQSRINREKITVAMVVKPYHSLFVLLIIICCSTWCSGEEDTPCSEGSVCYPYGQPDTDTTDRTEPSNYCCLAKNRTRASDKLPDDTYNCTCKLDLTLDSQTQKWADDTHAQGRMCLAGDQCRDFKSKNVVNDRFTYCCAIDDPSPDAHTKITVFDGDKMEYVGCRCVNDPLPTPTPGSYILPPVVAFNSTGESCYYDNDCNDRPLLKCAASYVTFCCYGSRGMVTVNDDEGTRCTCTNEIYGTQCEATPFPMGDGYDKHCYSGAACFPDNQLPDGVDNTNPSYYCCLDKNYIRRSTKQDNGTYNCSCKFDPDVQTRMEDWADISMGMGRMCLHSEDCADIPSKSTTNNRFVTCCPLDSYNGTSVSEHTTAIDSDKLEFLGCRCKNHPGPTKDPDALTMPPVAYYNSSGESCFYGEACSDRPAAKCEFSSITFCCYSSRGIVMTSDRQSAQCTCTNQLFGDDCRADPNELQMPCLSQCTGQDSKCVDGQGEERCCPGNMAVVATQPQGNFTSCTCTTGQQKHCDGDTSSATTVLGLPAAFFLAAMLALLLE